MIIELVFHIFHPYEKSRCLLNFSSMYISNEQKNITYKFTIARQKINAEATHDFFKRKPPPTFSHFSVSHHTYTTNFTLDYHSTLPRINHIRRYERNITWTTHIPIQRKRLEIMKMMVSWKRFNTRTEKESLFEDIVCYILSLIVGVL